MFVKIHKNSALRFNTAFCTYEKQAEITSFRADFANYHLVLNRKHRISLCNITKNRTPRRNRPATDP